MTDNWIAVDLDRTLAKYDEWHGASHVGEPIVKMIEFVKGALKNGIEVRIFTARVSQSFAKCPMKGSWNDTWYRTLYDNNHISEETFQSVIAIRQFCRSNFGQPLTITCVKDTKCVAIYDDIAHHVTPNEGNIDHGHEN